MYCCALVFVLFSIIKAETWEGHLVLDPDGKYHVWWSTSGDNITFEVQVETRGWVGFGISPNGDMTGSDVVIGWINNGIAVFHDRQAKGRFMPIIDDDQDWELLWCCENDTHTILRFRRPLYICKDQDFDISLDETTKLVYAYNFDDPQSATTVRYHGSLKRGSKSVYLLQKGVKTNMVEENNSYTWEVRMPNIAITHEKDTAYYCTVFIRPRLMETHHIIKAEAVLKPGNEKFVHHMILYECTDVKDEIIMPYLEKDFHECYSEDQTPIFYFCFTIAYGWAVGGEAFYLPENVGMPFGTSDAVWFVLEVHYDNPGLVRGVTDNSGVKLTYTPKLRTYDSAVLAIGNFWYPCIFVPPEQEDFIISGHAHPSCLSQRIPPEGIQVFAILLHSHTIGKRLKVRHFRGDEELPPLVVDNSYDFNYQEIRLLKEEITVYPNDHLILECTYDSTKRRETTFEKGKLKIWRNKSRLTTVDTDLDSTEEKRYVPPNLYKNNTNDEPEGGLSTKEEMCMAFMMYYPKLRLAISISCPSASNVVKSLGVTELSDDDRFLISPLSGQNESYVDFLNSYPWDTNSVKSVQRAMKYSPHLILCSDRGGKPILVFTLSRYPKVKKSYRKRDVCSSRRGSPKETNQKPDYPRPQESETGKPQPQPEKGQQPPKRKVIPQTMPYELIEEALKQMG